MQRTVVSRDGGVWSLRRFKSVEWKWGLWELPEREAVRYANQVLRVPWDSWNDSDRRHCVDGCTVAADHAVGTFCVDSVFTPLFPEVFDGLEVVLNDLDAEVLVALGLFDDAGTVAAAMGFGSVADFAVEVHYAVRMRCLASVRAWLVGAYGRKALSDLEVRDGGLR